MNKKQYCNKISYQIKDEKKATVDYYHMQLQSTNKAAKIILNGISEDENGHKMQLEHIYAQVCL